MKNINTQMKTRLFLVVIIPFVAFYFLPDSSNAKVDLYYLFGLLLYSIIWGTVIYQGVFKNSVGAMALKQNVGFKIAFGFGSVLSIFLFILMFNLAKVIATSDEITQIVEHDIPLSELISSAQEYQLRQAVDFEKVFRNAYSTKAEAKKNYEKAIMDYKKDGSHVDTELVLAEKEAHQIENIAQDSDVRNKFKSIAEQIKALGIKHSEYQKHSEEVFALINEGQMEKAEQMAVTLDVVQEELNHTLEKFHLNIQSFTDSSAHAAESHETATINSIIFLGIFASFFGLIFALVITKQISNPIKDITSAAKELAYGNVKIELKNKSDDEIGELSNSFREIIVAQKTKVNAAKEITLGNMVDVKIASEKDELGIAMNEQVETIKHLIKETSELVNSAKDGNLSARSNDSQFNGAWQDLLAGINSLMNEIVKPINDSSEVLAILSTGDLTARMTKTYNGDFELLKKSINTLGQSLDEVVSEVTEAVQATASASTQISSSAEEMAAGAQEQSAQTSDIASAVEEMSKTIFETTQNTTSAAESAKDAGVIASESEIVVKKAVDGMNKISVVVSEAAETVKELGKNSDEIGSIIQVINDIADQTNLLALNAAIEAARAGEQGRGFAVVADEVRKLAERTTGATKEIAGMVKNIQDDTGDAVSSIEQGVKEVENGKELAQKAGSSMVEIVNATDNVLSQISQAAAAGEEQASASEQISKNIVSISTVADESASGIEQIAMASEDLNRLTENLQNMVSKFKVANSVVNRPSEDRMLSQYESDNTSLLSDVV